MSEKKVYEGLDVFTHNLIGYFKQKQYKYKNLEKRAKNIHLKSLEYSKYDLEFLHKEIRKLKPFFMRNKLTTPIIDDALSIIVEICHRSILNRPYVVQIAGALALFEKYIVEMATGEGKTMTLSLSSILFAWQNKPTHLFTSNEYLASRDTELMRPLYENCLVSVGFVSSDMQNDEKIQNYKKDVVYTTSNAVLADYLRDEMAVEYKFDSQMELIHSLKKDFKKHERTLARGLHIAIIDEADSVLADDALTPLIISFQQEDKELQKAIIVANKIANTMKNKFDYESNKLFMTVDFLLQGEDVLRNCAKKFPKKWSTKSRVEYLIRQAIIAKDFYKLNKQYIIGDGKILIVDEKTGRIMSSRSWSGGLHQAIEAKEGLEFTNPTKANSKMSFQKFFRMYTVLCGMTGTVKNIEKELWQIYELNIAKIPTRLKKNIKINKDSISKNEIEKIEKIIEEIEKIQATNRPILIGTRNIIDSKLIYNELVSKGYKNIEILNAVNAEEEVDIISKAGELGKITIATNMAGRGTDIKLSQESILAGGLHIIATERNESRRVDLQLYGRTSRQGQPGSASTFLSLDDNLIELYVPKFLIKLLKDSINLSISRNIAINLYKICQLIAEKNASATRRKMLAIDHDFHKKMSFAKTKAQLP